ncbi:unnamed protein product [Soboliphyme baturini]|uniref:Myeloid leukemia factor n=1 Tax=Soboliphyme baturini TaxID=241478 RepID=A0A183INH0_9BILA|nr:unnamed protein product [Soboliphyme baturini]
MSDEDNDVHGMMRRQMQDMENIMDRMMMDPFADMFPGTHRLRPRQQMIEDDYGRVVPNRMPQHNQLMPRSAMDDFMMPFGGGLFGGISSMMQQMEGLRENALQNPNAHVYSHSSVVSFQQGPDGRPKYYEKTKSIRKAGDIAETRDSVRDSERGIEKMAIGHHMGGKSHIIEKERDESGRIIENQDFVGLNQNEVEEFDNEFALKTGRTARNNRSMLEQASRAPLSIENGPRRYRQNGPSDSDVSGQGGVVIEELPDNYDENLVHNSSPNRDRKVGGAMHKHENSNTNTKGEKKTLLGRIQRFFCT